MSSDAPGAFPALVLAGGLAALLAVAFLAFLVVQQRRFLALTREMHGRLLLAHEAERARVARELHDDLIQRVAVLGHDIGALEVPEDRAEQLQRLRADLHALADEMRRLAHRMHPSALDHLGLPGALEHLAQELARTTGLKVAVAADARAAQLPQPLATALYRVVQEALRNVTRHAGCDSAAVALSLARDAAVLEVRDGGCGFDPHGPAASTGLGLRSMQERVRLVDGRISYNSTPGAGTTIVVRVPLEVPIA